MLISCMFFESVITSVTSRPIAKLHSPHVAFLFAVPISQEFTFDANRSEQIDSFRDAASEEICTNINTCTVRVIMHA